MDVQPDIGHVVEMLAGDKPNDLADFAFGIVAAKAGESFRADLFLFRELRHVVERGAVRVGKERARVVFVQRIKLGFIHRRFDWERPGDIDAEKTGVDSRDLMSDEQDHLRRQQKLFVGLL